MKFIFKLLWDFCEYFSISLGKFAPYVLGKMYGVKLKDTPSETFKRWSDDNYN